MAKTKQRAKRKAKKQATKSSATKRRKVSEKVCFVVCAIGSEGSNTRKRADQVLEHVIRPAAEKVGYTVVRVDEDQNPGQITVDIIRHLLEDSMVVADLTGKNPNVYYELAVRHCFRKPSVQIIENEDLPFDLYSQRTIQFDMTNPDSWTACRDKLSEYIEAAAKEGESANTPVSVATTVMAEVASGQPLEAAMESMQREITALRTQVSRQQEKTSSPGYGSLSAPKSSDSPQFTLQNPPVVSLDDYNRFLSSRTLIFPSEEDAEKAEEE